jgi:ATP cone domain/AF1548-like, C-terminal/Restriction endonuclease
MSPSQKKTNDSIRVKKASGEIEPFSTEKLERSLRMTGASPQLVQRVIDRVRKKAGHGVTSRKLHQMAFQLLRKEARHLAARYSLKRAVMSLGPSGYPFEKFIGALLEKQGYQTEVGVVLNGACVTHEVDVVALKGKLRRLVECKYHNREGIKCDVKVPLYVYARSLDLKNNPPDQSIHEFWLVTNTKFTSDAIRYGKCVGLKLLSWDYPEGNSLKQQIEREEIHPITCLTSLKSREKKQLLEKNVVLCHEISKNPERLKEIGMKDPQINRVVKEVTQLIEY